MQHAYRTALVGREGEPEALKSTLFAVVHERLFGVRSSTEEAQCCLSGRSGIDLKCTLQTSDTTSGLVVHRRRLP